MLSAAERASTISILSIIIISLLKAKRIIFASREHELIILLSYYRVILASIPAALDAYRVLFSRHLFPYIVQRLALKVKLLPVCHGVMGRCLYYTRAYMPLLLHIRSRSII